VVERNKRKHSSLQQEIEKVDIFAVPSFATQKKYNNEKCIVLVLIICINLLLFVSMGIGGHALLVCLGQFCSFIYLSHDFTYMCLFHQKWWEQ